MSTPIDVGTLISEATCYCCFAPEPIPEMLELALWSRITQNDASGGSGTITLSKPGLIEVVSPATGEYDFSGTDWVTVTVNNCPDIIGANFSSMPSLVTLNIINQPTPAIFYAADCANLSAVNITGTTALGDLDFDQDPSLITLSLPLVSCGALGIFNMVNLTSFSAPVLDTIGNNFDAFGNFVMSTVSLPLLRVVSGHINFNNSNALVSLQLPSLQNFSGAFNLNLCPILTTLNLSGLISRSSGTVGNFLDASDSTALTTVNFPALWPFVDGFGVSFNNCALNVATVNSILVSALAAVPAITGETIDLSGGTSAAPSGAGAAAKAALILAGNTVTTN